MKRNISGIYIIKNTINDKVYIGSAVCIKQRFIGHKNQFKKQVHNDRFQNFVNKYGINTLIFEVIEYVNDKEKLIKREQYWIDYYESWKSKKGFNICKTAGSTIGVKMPKSHIESSKKRMMGNEYRKEQEMKAQYAEVMSTLKLLSSSSFLINLSFTFSEILFLHHYFVGSVINP